MSLSDLRPNQRYLFHYKNPHNKDDSTFRANFVQLFVREKWITLIVDGYESKKYPNEQKKTWWSIDINLVSTIESLPNILNNKCVLPDDILLDIDNYF